MDEDLKPSDNDIKTVLETHSLLPEGPLVEEGLVQEGLIPNTTGENS